MGCTRISLAVLFLLAVSVQGISPPDIYSLRVLSEIKNRFAKTLVTSRVANPADQAQEVFFDAVLPEKAFVSSFVIEMDGVAYHAKVKGKEEARQQYDDAVSQGRGAAHVAVSARDSNVVHVSVNVEAQKKVTFNMTYEEFLVRERGAYVLRVNMDPRQLVNDLSVEVNIHEQTPIQLVQVPTLQETNEILDTPDNTTEPLAVIERPTPSSATVRWAPTKAQQAERSEAGIKGQLLVRYDVDHAASPDQILVSEDGYFVHFYAPPDLPTLPKHVVFVLDVSGSMSGRKIEQLKSAMHTILDELHEGDTFSLIPFASRVQVWQPGVELIFNSFWEESLNPSFNASAIVPATTENIAQAKSSVSSFSANGATYMFSALTTALRVLDAGVSGGGRRRHAPMLILLTDGEPNGNVDNTDEIVRRVTARNAETGAALFTLAFGAGADYSFLRRLALRNSGMGKRIYEAADAHLQLRDFYRQIASPLLADVTFNYDSEQVDEVSLTTVSFPTLFRGGELVVAGRLSSPDALPMCTLRFGLGNATTTTQSVANASSSERLWAYLTVRQLLDQDAATPNVTIRDKAKEIALRYSFVTSVTSLVVVKPNATSAVDLDSADASDSSVVPLMMPGRNAAGGLPGVRFSPPAAPRTHVLHSMPSFPSLQQSSAHLPVGFSYNLRAPSYSFDADDLQPTFDSAPIPAQRLQLSDVTWLDQVRNGSDVTLTVNNTERHFQLAVNQTGDSFGSCSTPQSEPGTCRHLAACVLAAFSHDLQAFVGGYLCVAGNGFLGTCCPNSVLVHDPW